MMGRGGSALARQHALDRDDDQHFISECVALGHVGHAEVRTLDVEARFVPRAQTKAVADFRGADVLDARGDFFLLLSPENRPNERGKNKERFYTLIATPTQRSAFMA